MDSIPATTPVDKTQLCELCKVLELPSLFKASTAKPSMVQPPSILRDYVLLLQQKNCAFCQLLIRTFQLNSNSHTFTGKTIAGMFETFAQRGVLPGFGRRIWVVGLETETDERRLRTSSSKSNWGYCIQPALESCDFNWATNPSLLARQIDQHRVDLRLIKSWINLCRGCHLTECNPSQRNASRQYNFRVIDVVHKQIVIAPANCKYVALSYVWGQAKQVMNLKEIRSILTMPGGMCSLDIPRTISDAMELCKELGENYLWVDALCIQQDEENDVKSQIANMDQVYSCAEFTIIAAAGGHCNIGLPAFNGSRDLSQHTENICGMRFVSTQRHPTSAAETSKWNTRGWTFQENMLSRRLLVFTNAQVFFRCSRALWCEDISAECLNSVIRLSDGQWLNRQVSRSKSSLVYTRRLWETSVKSLLNRDLTVDGDILNAFEGISKTMQSELGSFYWGLPENNFERALMWRTNGAFPTTRRLGFPSWSWAGWKHEKQTGYIPEWVYDEKETSVVTYHHFNEGGEIVQIHCGEEQVKMELDPEVRAHFECSSTPMSRIENFQFRNHLLIFWTSSAIIHLLRIEPNQYIVGGLYTNYEIHRFNSFTLRDEWYNKHPNGVEFIVISTGPQKYHREWAFDTMIIEWIDGIAYRIQVPGVQTQRLSQDFWLSSKPQRKLITLG